MNNIEPHELERGTEILASSITHLRDWAFATFLKICPDLVAVNL